MATPHLRAYQYPPRFYALWQGPAKIDLLLLNSSTPKVEVGACEALLTTDGSREKWFYRADKQARWNECPPLGGFNIWEHDGQWKLLHIRHDWILEGASNEKARCDSTSPCALAQPLAAAFGDIMHACVGAHMKHKRIAHTFVYLRFEKYDDSCE